MTRPYLSYLMGASGITDDDLLSLGVEIVGRAESGSRKLRIPVSSRENYEQLVIAKLSSGFWNDIVSEDEIIFIFKLKDNTVKRFVFSEELQGEIGALCSELNGDPIEKTSNVLVYLVGNAFYEDTIRRYVYAHLPRKWAATGGLVLNSQGDVLIVKPTYRPKWSIVGGNISAGEMPLHCFIRETQEEIGLTISHAELRCIQYVTDPGYQGDRIHFIFDAGVLTEEQIKEITVDGVEISEFRFVPLEDAVTLLGDGLGERITAAYFARQNNTIAYLERAEAFTGSAENALTSGRG